MNNKFARYFLPVCFLCATIYAQDYVGTYLPEIEIVKELQTADSIQFTGYKAYVFSKNHAELSYSSDIKLGIIQCGIDLDTLIVKQIDALLTKENITEAFRKNRQYHFQRERYNPNLPDQYLLELKKYEKEAMKRFEKNLKKLNCYKWDRQYFGYITKSGEKIVEIRLIDFGNDQYHDRAKVNQRIISIFTDTSGYPRIYILHYNLTTKKLTID